MIYRYTTFIKAINLSIDYTILNISMVIAYLIVDKSYIFWAQNKNYLPVVLVFNLIWLLSANITGLYEQVLNKDSISTYQSVFKTYLLFVCLICFTIIIIIGPAAYSITREYLFYALALFGFLVGIWKLIFLAIRKSDRNLLIDGRNVIIVGAGTIGHDLYHYFKSNPDKGYNVLGFFDDDPKKISQKGMYLGNTDNCIDYVITNQVDEIFCALPVSSSDKIEQLMLDADKHLIRFKIVPEYYIASKKAMTVQNFDHIPVIAVRAEPLENMLNRMMKRLFDFGFSCFVIVFILSWLYPLLALIIKMQSPGPALFVQLRSGRDNLPFKCYKFRSMRMNNDSDKVQATKGDKRVTKIGAIMRRTSLDELPQFFNVLMGEMSIVGPRPHMLSHTEEYSKLIDQFMVRHFMKPGITGWAQIKGYRGETKTTNDMMERVEADVWYLENWSFLLDLKIIFLTVWNAVKGEENAF
ncbi:undecaprenyl-phosphate glucose phosphotransferase [Mucilaginibacter myungsuensis]|uniref:Undecaprenyl-phosphate glucose phosphotransferase n=1 Tax=Mucilaginibacter myungsuensis TaxID=649104 RepID=A0A929KY84_9SPHI|nr:undecaprenyl-phosphate glucose phosphotransferase [Mucilaginibacter myungsuensis]MBE9662653.1 undecaprenyl-phosphate glucose phosphotransferase [Mucilaginibacter myungsuensis]MDN3598073.1 undecaprenyl-phosphate glucose phosphotransferase [Mucilaginibacter myungsuensis]